MLNVGLGLLEQTRDIAIKAGQEIMKIYQTDFNVDTKDDNSPVTLADKIAEELIIQSITSEISDKYPIVGEEAVGEGNIPVVTDTAFWLVDPLDGTKEFVNRNGEFTVNIALIENGKPILGVVHAPAIQATYWAASLGAFARHGEGKVKQIRCRSAPVGGLSALVSRSHPSPEVEEFLLKYDIGNRVSAGSSLKFCLVAEGQADLYPRMGRTMEWDTAAGHAVLRFAGGQVYKTDGMELRYGKSEFENPHFIAVSPDVEIRT